MSDKTIARLRQGVPLVWGLIVTALLDWWTGAPEWVADALGSELVVNVVIAGVAFAWYLAWRLIERYVPPWVLAIALGSSRSPTYVPRHSADDEAAG